MDGNIFFLQLFSQVPRSFVGAAADDDDDDYDDDYALLHMGA